MKPTYPISVLLPCHSLKFLESSIESISKQTFGKDYYQVVIVADRVHLNDLSIILAKFDLNFKVLEAKTPGIVAALNLGLEEISSKYVVRMDEDDLMESTRLAKQFQYMEEHMNVMALGGQLQLINELGKELGIARYPKKVSEKDILMKSPIAHPAAIFRVDAVKSIGGYRSFLPEDWDLWVRLSEIGEIANHKDVVLKYRVHPGQLSRDKMYAQFTGQRFVAASFFARRCKLKDCPDSGENSNDWLERTQLQLEKQSPEFASFKKWSAKGNEVSSMIQIDSKLSKIRGLITVGKDFPVFVTVYIFKILLFKLKSFFIT